MISYSKITRITLAISCVFTLLVTDALTQRRRQSSPPFASSEPLTQPRLFAEGIINSSADEYGPTFTRDGRTIYFTRRVNRRDAEAIVFSRFENGRWSAPQTAPFSGRYFDKEPYISPDGRRLFFASRRPDAEGAPPRTGRDFDIWMVEQANNGWSSPIHLGPEINTTNYENYPAVAANGNLYFASVREGGRGGNDLYCARFVNGRYMPAENLSDSINTPATEADPYIAPDESYMIFSSDRQGTYGEGDLYVSFREGGRWTEPRNLGNVINTSEYEYTPFVTPGGQYLFFSRGWGEIYQIELSVFNIPRRERGR